MNNTTTRLLLGSSLIVVGVVLIGTTRARRGRRSFFAIARKQAGVFAEQALHRAHLAKREALKLSDAAVHGLADAMEVGKAAYQRVAG
ncbi:MAG TPA: hypothetical protein VHY84_19170 [Bryobacteraceae bacterium]|jgi:hypothetical protein|nr:hypothetical protein [Bryobacteraceae bacterium]